MRGEKQYLKNGVINKFRTFTSSGQGLAVTIAHIIAWLYLLSTLWKQTGFSTPSNCIMHALTAWRDQDDHDQTCLYQSYPLTHPKVVTVKALSDGPNQYTFCAKAVGFATEKICTPPGGRFVGSGFRLSWALTDCTWQRRKKYMLFKKMVLTTTVLITSDLTCHQCAGGKLCT